MYLKVPYKPGDPKEFATVEDVQQALKVLVPDVEGLTVDNDLNYPCVEFAPGTPHTVYERVEKALNDAGWEAY